MIKFLLLGTGLIAVLLALREYVSIKSVKYNKADDVIGKMNKVASLIRVGGYSCLNTQYRYLFFTMPVVYLGLLLRVDSYLANGVMLGFISSIACLYYSLEIALSGNIITAITTMRSTGLKDGFIKAYSCGRSTGTFIIGVALITVFVFLCVPNNLSIPLDCEIPSGRLLDNNILFLTNRQFMLMLGTCLGASIVSIFARLAGGVFTKAADIGADLVGKIFQDIPEDDPRNPGVIADNIGDNIGDCGGTATDIYETYIYAFMAIIAWSVSTVSWSLCMQESIIIVPILSSTLGSLIAINLVRKLTLSNNEPDATEGSKIIVNRMRDMILSGIGISFGLFFVMSYVAGLMTGFSFTDRVASSIIPYTCGLALVLVILWLTNYYTSRSHSPVKKMADSCKDGASMNIILGYSVSLEAAFVVMMTIVSITFVSWKLFEMPGVCITVLTMLGFLSSIMTMDAYGPIVDNAGGIVSMSGASERTRYNTDILDSVGNLTKALTKGYSSGIMIITAFLLLKLFIQQSNIILNTHLSILSISRLSYALDSSLLFGALIGASLPFIFSSLVIRSVHRAAKYMVRVISHTLKTETPDNDLYYTRPIKTLTAKSVKYMAFPILSILFPFILCGLLRYFGILDSRSSTISYIAGMLLGVISSGSLLSISMTIGGAAWDNTKKLVEEYIGEKVAHAKLNLKRSMQDFNLFGKDNSILDISKALSSLSQLADSTPDEREGAIVTQVSLLNKWIEGDRANFFKDFDIEKAFETIKNPEAHGPEGHGSALLTKIFREYGALELLKDTKNASVIGDTFGDPLKDAAGTSLNVMIKLTIIIAFTMITLFI